MSDALVIRPASPADIDALRDLQAVRDARARRGLLHAAEVEAAVRHVCVPDRELIDDGTYPGRRARRAARRLRRLEPAAQGVRRAGAQPGRRRPPRSPTEPTHIRAMFTAPDVARQGVGRAILAAAEDAARAAGFRRARLGATRSGEAFYRRSGYAEIGRETACCPTAPRSRSF